MVNGKIYLKDIGVKFEVDMGRDMREATLLKIFVKKPNGTELEWTAIVDLTPTPTEENPEPIIGNGICFTNTLLTDLDVAGEYSVQGYGEWGSSSKHLGETATFMVYRKYS